METNTEKKISKIKFFLTRNAIKAGIFALVGAFLVTGNFLIENGVLAFSDEESVYDFTVGEEVLVPENGVFRFADEVLHGFSNQMELFKKEDDSYIFTLKSGKFWGNFVSSNADVDIVADKVVIMPNGASFNLEFDGEKLELFVFEGDVYLGFLDEGVYLNDFVDEYSDQFINRLLVPRDTKVSIAMGQVGSQWGKLLFSKLVKEVKHSFITDEKRQGEWVLGNMSKDDKQLQVLKDRIFSKINSNGYVLSGGALSDLLFWAEENMTFFPDRKRKIVFDHLFSSLDNAIYFAVNGDKAKSLNSLEVFKGNLAILDSELRKSDDFYEKFDAYLDRLVVFGPGDEAFDILKFLLERKVLDGRDKYQVINSFWQSVYQALRIDGDFVALEAFDNYYDFYERTLGDVSDIAFYSKYITYQNQLLDSLLLKSPLFYKDKYFGIKNAGLEQQLLRLYEAGELKEELKQAFVGQKIRFLKRLRTFFFEEKVEVDEANKIAKRLFKEISDLIPADDSDVAVVEFFEKQIADMADFFDYLDSSEYNSSKIYGVNQAERYEYYLKEKPFISNFEQIRSNVFGEKSVDEEGSIEDVQSEIAATLAEFEDVSDYKLGEIKDSSQRYIDITLAISGYSVSAVFDREKAGVKDVYVYGELISDRLVKLGSLTDLLHDKFANVEVSDFDSDSSDEILESAAERTARIFVAKKLLDAGFEADEDNIKVIDSLNVVYRVENVNVATHKTTLLTFDFLMSGEVATNLYMKIKGDPVVVEGKFTLEQLLSLATGETEPSDLKETGIVR